MKNKILTALIFFCAVFSFAQSHISTQAHESAVNSLAVLNGITTDENTVFSVGQDGFIIKWTEDGLGEHPKRSIQTRRRTGYFGMHDELFWRSRVYGLLFRGTICVGFGTASEVGRFI